MLMCRQSGRWRSGFLQSYLARKLGSADIAFTNKVLLWWQYEILEFAAHQRED